MRQNDDRKSGKWRIPVRGVAGSGIMMIVEASMRERRMGCSGLGYTAAKHQHEMGAGYFDRVLITVTGGDAATAALTGST